MLAMNFSSVRESFKDYCDRVVNDCETLIITRKGEDQNVVLMSLSEYNNLMENLEIMTNKPYYDSLIRGIEKVRKGQVIRKTNQELERLLEEE